MVKTFLHVKLSTTIFTSNEVLKKIIYADIIRPNAKNRIAFK